MILWIVTIVLAIAADQISKLLVLRHLAPGSVTVIPGVLDFTYVENRGAAFGLFADRRWVFLILSTVAIAVVLIYLIKARPQSRLMRFSLALVAGGGAANMIDRVGRGFVVDFIDATFIDFYVFNIADSCVCVGCGLLILWMIIDTVKEHRASKAAAAQSAETETAETESHGSTEEDDG